MIFSAPDLKHILRKLNILGQRQIIQQVPVVLDCLGHFVPIYVCNIFTVTQQRPQHSRLDVCIRLSDVHLSTMGHRPKGHREISRTNPSNRSEIDRTKDQNLNGIGHDLFLKRNFPGLEANLAEVEMSFVHCCRQRTFFYLQRGCLTNENRYNNKTKF